jgi:Fe-S-cluster containining protein
MVMPAIAMRTYKMFEKDSTFRKLIKKMTTKLSKISDPVKRARYVHDKIDQEITAIMGNPGVKELVQCKKKCSACCHSQVAVTQEEAELLALKIDEGVEIDFDLLNKQAQAGNSSSDYFKLSYSDRRCVFLTDDGLCKVYADRPSVCRTNYVLSEPSQCEIKSGESPSVQLLNTFSADSWVYSLFHVGKENGTLASLLKKKILSKKSKARALFPWDNRA